jgi:uncharacterized membrane protein
MHVAIVGTVFCRHGPAKEAASHCRGDVVYGIDIVIFSVIVIVIVIFSVIVIVIVIVIIPPVLIFIGGRSGCCFTGHFDLCHFWRGRRCCWSR